MSSHSSGSSPPSPRLGRVAEPAQPSGLPLRHACPPPPQPPPRDFSAVMSIAETCCAWDGEEDGWVDPRECQPSIVQSARVLYLDAQYPSSPRVHTHACKGHQQCAVLMRGSHFPAAVVSPFCFRLVRREEGGSRAEALRDSAYLLVAPPQSRVRTISHLVCRGDNATNPPPHPPGAGGAASPAVGI